MSARNSYNGVTIQRIMLTQTSRYHPEFLRPYMTVATRKSLSDLSDVILEKGATTVTQADVARVANGVLSLASEVNEDDIIDIENGYEERRFSFLIECLESDGMGGSADLVFITGYTDREDYARSHSRSDEIFLPDDLRFYITGVKRFSDDRLVANDQIITPRTSRIHSQHQRLNLIRPMDVARTITAMSSIGEGVDVINGIGNISFSATMQGNRYTNNTASSYISSFVNAVLQAERSMNSSAPSIFGGYSQNYDRGRDQADKYARVDSLLREKSVLSPNSFIYNMRGSVTSFRQDAWFEYGDLKEHYGVFIDEITDVITFDSARQDLSGLSLDSNNHAQWDDGTNGGRNAVIATIIKQSITGLMIESLVQRCSLEITNCIPNPIDGIHGFEVTVTSVMFLRRLSPDMERTLIDNLRHDVVQRIMMDATLDGDIDVDVVVDADLYGDIYVDVGVGGGVMVPFKSASYSLALTAPTITYDTKAIEVIGHDLNQAVDSALRHFR